MLVEITTVTKSIEPEEERSRPHPYMVDSNWYPDENGRYRFKFLFDKTNLTPAYRERLEKIQKEAMKSKRNKSDGIHFAISPNKKV